MSYFKLQYKFELIHGGEWKDERSHLNVHQAHEEMLKHIEEYPDIQCRIVKVEGAEKEVGRYKPVQAYEHTEDSEDSV